MKTNKSIPQSEKARQGWAEVFAEMADCGHDVLMDDADSMHNEFDVDEWEWN